MPTPIERLEARKQLQECRVCSWLITLDDKMRAPWTQALNNPRYGNEAIASLMREDQGVVGLPVGESSVRIHRLRGHK